VSTGKKPLSGSNIAYIVDVDREEPSFRFEYCLNCRCGQGRTRFPVRILLKLSVSTGKKPLSGSYIAYIFDVDREEFAFRFEYSLNCWYRQGRSRFPIRILLKLSVSTGKKPLSGSYIAYIVDVDREEPSFRFEYCLNCRCRQGRCRFPVRILLTLLMSTGKNHLSGSNIA